MKCRLKDGPLCNPLDIYHTHSTAIYEPDHTIPRNITSYKQIMSDRFIGIE